MTDRNAQFDLFGTPAPAVSPAAGPRASLYLALLPNEAVREQIKRVLPTLLAQGGLDGSAVKPERWHSTLFALGEGGPPPAELLASARAVAGSMRASAFTISFDRLRLYRGSGALVLANGESGSAAEQFSVRLFHAFKFAGLRPHSRGAAHITLMYSAAKGLSDLPLAEPIRWAVESFALVHSTSRRYEAVDRWSLG